MTWLMPFRLLDERPVLVCLPQAGSGCGVFRSWQAVLGDEVTVVGVQLPGRESRYIDPAPDSFADAVHEIVSELKVHNGRPIILFGHSLGGLFGYEIARVLPEPPVALVVAASQPPHRSGPSAGISVDTDEGFAKTLADKGVDEELRELAMAVLRQDAELARTYEDPGGEPVPCDLHVWGGDTDERVSKEELGQWRRYAGRGFHHRQFAGGHDFCLETPDVPRELLLTVGLGS